MSPLRLLTRLAVILDGTGIAYVADNPFGLVRKHAACALDTVYQARIVRLC